MSAKLDTQRLIDDCRCALAESDTAAAVQDLIARVVCEPAAIIAALGEPRLGGVETLYRADDLTILNIVWPPAMTLHPHDHRMWATIGIYAGREDNVFYRRDGDGLRRHGVKELSGGDTLALGETVIHEVSNPLDQFTAALHVYGGDFFAMPRSEWDPETLSEHAYDIEHTREAFRQANEAWQRRDAGARRS